MNEAGTTLADHLLAASIREAEPEFADRITRTALRRSAGTTKSREFAALHAVRQGDVIGIVAGTVFEGSALEVQRRRSS